MGRYTEARDLAQDTLDRSRRIRGDDHPDTLAFASNLAVRLFGLGEVQAARDLDQDTLDRRRRVLGDDHPDTLESADSLAADLYALGDVQAARDLAQDTLDRSRRILGDDHPNPAIREQPHLLRRRAGLNAHTRRSQVAARTPAALTDLGRAQPATSAD